MVVEKIKGEKGEFWCDFANVGKLMSRHCTHGSGWLYSYCALGLKYNTCLPTSIRPPRRFAVLKVQV